MNDHIFKAIQNPGSVYCQGTTIYPSIEKRANLSNTAIVLGLVDEISGLPNIMCHNLY